jgi:hypothetical protein
MSTRFDAAGDRISFAGSMFAVGSGFTMTAWAYVSVDTDTFATVARLHASSASTTVVTWATGGDGLSGPNYFTGGGTVTNATNMAVGQWRKIALSCSGTTGRSYIATVGGATEVDSGTVSVGTPDGLTLAGRGPADSSEVFNGRLAYVRIWTAELSQSQIEAEWASTTPVVTSGLWADWPLTDSTDLTDHSGNGRNLTAGGTAVSTEDNPPLSGSVTGSAAAAFGGLTGAASGVRTVSGTSAGAFGGLTGAAAGTRSVNGTATFTGGALSGTATGVRTVIGSAVAQFGGLTGTAVSPSSITGSASAAFGGLTATAHSAGPAAPEQGSWQGLLDILREGVSLAREELERDPVACDCGEPLRTHEGVLYCPFDGSTWAAGNRRTGHVSTAGR